MKKNIKENEHIADEYKEIVADFNKQNKTTRVVIKFFIVGSIGSNGGHFRSTLHEKKHIKHKKISYRESKMQQNDEQT